MFIWLSYRQYSFFCCFFFYLIIGARCCSFSGAILVYKSGIRQILLPYLEIFSGKHRAGKYYLIQVLRYNLFKGTQFCRNFHSRSTPAYSRHLVLIQSIKKLTSHSKFIFRNDYGFRTGNKG